MPAGAAEHCAVVVPGPAGREVVVTGGRGRGARVMKLNLRSRRWYSLHRLGEGRRGHACTKVTINGRPGLAVSGGVSASSTNMTSVEFYDVTSGQWHSLPGLQRGRREHAMLVQDGRLVVTGGLQGRGHLLRDGEVFDGRRWVDSRQQLATGRRGFSLIKVPAARLARRRRPRARRVHTRAG
jgi:hypothetical protein